MKTFRYLLMIIFAVLFFACKEENRFEIGSSDKTPPGAPVVRGVIPLYGGARIFFTRPADEDLLMITAEFTAPNGKLFKFSTSYFKDSLDVYGLGSTIDYTLKLYAVDRSGNESAKVPVTVRPLESSIERVSKTIVVRPGFGAFYIDWYNELRQTVNVYIDFEFTQAGYHSSLVQVYSSNYETERRFIRDLTLGPNEPVNMKIRVEDIYGNITEPIEIKNMVLLQDSKIPKAKWVLPQTNDSIAGIPMCFGNGADGRIGRVIDDIVETREGSSNYMHSGEKGRTGVAGIPDANIWNLLIDLGDYYELSRIVTNQRHTGGSLGLERGQYYRNENVGNYKLYYLDEAADEWIFISEHFIPVPVGLTDLEIVKKAEKGDEEYMYPENPGFTPPVRWFRYESIRGFPDNYTSKQNNCLSELTLFGRKANK